MKLFILRGFETCTYTTHTYFMATSMEQAWELASYLYDKVKPLIAKHDELTKKHEDAQRAWQEEYNANEAQREKARQDKLEELKKDLENNYEAYKNLMFDRRTSSDYYSAPKEEQRWLHDNAWVQWVEDSIGFHRDDKGICLQGWLEIYSAPYNQLDTDVLIHDAQTDGD